VVGTWRHESGGNKRGHQNQTKKKNREKKRSESEGRNGLLAKSFHNKRKGTTVYSNPQCRRKRPWPRNVIERIPGGRKKNRGLDVGEMKGPIPRNPPERPGGEGTTKGKSKA